MKKHIILSLIAALLATLFAAGGYFYGRRQPVPEAIAPAPHAEPGAAIPAIRKPLYWTDPMVPGSRFDQPGKSPFMDMELEPVYASEGGVDMGGGVRLDQATVQNMGVRTVRVEQGQIAHRIETVGIVRPDEHRIEAVHAHTAGWVEKVYVRAAGDPVRAGQPMFELNSPDLIAAQEEYLLALRHNDAALTQAAEQKLHLLYFHEAALQQLRESGQVQRRITVHAPASGVVSELMIRSGMAVTAGQPAYTLTNLSTVWVNAQVPEAQAQWAVPGTQAEVRLASQPGKVFKGRVEYLYPEVAEASRTLSARIQLVNPGGLLKPNMYADVVLLGGQGKTVALVPREAVIETGTRKVVIVADGHGRFHAQNVVTGSEADGKVEVLEGLGTGLEVVASGQFLIDSEANLKSALDRMQGEPAK
jgi:Cu(I)/Ag(I) efflux system membrane fusion protein